MRVSSTQKRFDSGTFKSVSIREQVKGRADDFVARSERVVRFGKAEECRAVFSLHRRSGNCLVTFPRHIAVALKMRMIGTARDGLLGLQPIQVFE